jgi:hypothetical protein
MLVSALDQDKQCLENGDLDTGRRRRVMLKISGRANKRVCQSEPNSLTHGGILVSQTLQI